MTGPEGSYKYYGHSNFHSSAGLNSLTLTNSGNRTIEFSDGTKFDFDYSKVILFLKIIRSYIVIHFTVL